MPVLVYFFTFFFFYIWNSAIIFYSILAQRDITYHVVYLSSVELDNYMLGKMPGDSMLFVVNIVTPDINACLPVFHMRQGTWLTSISCYSFMPKSFLLGYPEDNYHNQTRKSYFLLFT